MLMCCIIYMVKSFWFKEKMPSLAWYHRSPTNICSQNRIKENQKFCLGLKQLEDDPWKRIEDRMPVGSAVEGEAVRITEFGVFVELETGIEGLVHISEISEERVEKPSDKVTKGDKVKAVVISIDKQAKKIALSMKAVASGEYKSNYKAEVAQPSTLADKLKGFKV
jgi:small subunit ribosomal protein S1